MAHRIERHLAEARLPPGETLSGFEFDAVPTISKAQVMALVAGDGWLETGANLILFGPPGGGKTHLVAARAFASGLNRPSTRTQIVPIRCLGSQPDPVDPDKTQNTVSASA